MYDEPQKLFILFIWRFTGETQEVEEEAGGVWTSGGGVLWDLAICDINTQSAVYEFHLLS